MAEVTTRRRKLCPTCKGKVEKDKLCPTCGKKGYIIETQTYGGTTAEVLTQKEAAAKPRRGRR